jgi:ABC-type multidrug transport system ATPase subunit
VLQHLQVQEFRALKDFRMADLGRINLLVGTNNCGKTSVLEAVSMLLAPGSPGEIWRSLVRRGETRDDADFEVELGHLFHGHELTVDSHLTVAGEGQGSGLRLDARVAEREKHDPVPRRRARQGQLRFPTAEPDDEDGALRGMVLVLRWLRDGHQQELRLPITQRGGLSSEDSGPWRREEGAPVQLVTAETLGRDEIVSLLGDVLLTPEEETVLEALHAIEPTIERLATIAAPARRYTRLDRGGIAVKLGGQRVPIGSLGDGIWRILGITLALVRARGGVLLVDEIDTGLHYSVLGVMWRLVFDAATHLGVQVFATTHSRDCYESLAEISRPDGSDVTIQRIERGKQMAVALSEPEILQAARRSIELR